MAIPSQPASSPRGCLRPDGLAAQITQSSLGELTASPALSMVPVQQPSLGLCFPSSPLIVGGEDPAARRVVAIFRFPGAGRATLVFAVGRGGRHGSASGVAEWLGCARAEGGGSHLAICAAEAARKFSNQGRTPRFLKAPSPPTEFRGWSERTPEEEQRLPRPNPSEPPDTHASSLLLQASTGLTVNQAAGLMTVQPLEGCRPLVTTPDHLISRGPPTRAVKEGGYAERRPYPQAPVGTLGLGDEGMILSNLLFI